MLTITTDQAQNRLGEILDAARWEPIAITDQGHPLAYIISPEELQRLFASQEERDKAVLDYRAYQERVRQKASLETKVFSDEDVNRLIHELR